VPTGLSTKSIPHAPLQPSGIHIQSLLGVLTGIGVPGADGAVDEEHATYTSTACGVCNIYTRGV
jgi:uncharacterized protein GlcG (DUF336 family)